MTQAGMILGTAAYMSPEQVKGRAADKRSDVWAFGCVLYEMLTGARAFEGDDVTDTLASVLRADPIWTALPATTPSLIRRLLRRCLEKHRNRRLHDIGDARLDLEESFSGVFDAVMPDAASPQVGWRRAAATAIIASLATGVAVWSISRPAPSAPARTQRFTISVPASAPYAGVAGGELAISPDGTRLVYAATTGDKRLLYIRALDELDARPLPGTDDANAPFFSPDGEWVGFFLSVSNCKFSQ
jgi:hypothetical protein